MKTTSLFLTTILLIGAMLNACQPDQYKTVGTPAAAITTLAGTWKITQVKQTDADAANKGFPYQVMDLTNVFPYKDFTVTFNMNGSTPSTFTTVPGNSPKIITLPSGNWKVDDPTYPKVVTLINGSDSTKITLGAYAIGATPTLKVTLDKRNAATGKLLITYSYVFSKQ